MDKLAFAQFVAVSFMAAFIVCVIVISKLQDRIHALEVANIKLRRAINLLQNNTGEPHDPR